MDQRTSNILPWQTCLLHLTAPLLSASVCLLSFTTHELDPACCPQYCDLCLLRGGQAICSSSAGCIFRSAQSLQWSPDFPESLAPIQPSYCSVPNFQKCLAISSSCVFIHSCCLFCRSFKYLLSQCLRQHNDLSHCQGHL